MKKMIYSFALITALTVVSTANALWGDGGQQYEKPVTSFKKACEVCPYYDEEMCRNWMPDCREELDNLKTACTYSTSAACTAVAGHGTCTKDTSTGCYYPISCNFGYYQNTELPIIFNGTSNAVPSCMECPKNGTCNGTSVFCDSGYTLTSTNPNPSIIAFKGKKWCVNGRGGGSNTGTDTPTADTISGSCPNGLSKSADGCCCIK